MHSSTILSLLALAASTYARTDLTGCTSSISGPSLIWYVPGTGELCDFLDCGGGRAPPATTVPGCPQYSGTASYEPSYLPGYGPNAAVSTAAAAASSAAASSLIMTGAASTSFAQASATAGVSSSFATITTNAPVLSGTGGQKPTTSLLGNNLTATATLPTTMSVGTGAATALAAKEVIGVAVGLVAGLAML